MTAARRLALAAAFGATRPIVGGGRATLEQIAILQQGHSRMTAVGQTIKRVASTVKAAATADTRELQRLADRREVRDELGRRRLLEHQVDVLERRVAALHQEADRAADAHQATCRPIQDRLAVLEAEITGALSERREIPAGAEEERAELLEKVHVANETLSDASERVKRLVAPLEKERREIRQRIAHGAALEGKLTGPPLGNPDLLAEKFSATRRHEIAFARLEEAERNLREVQAALEIAEKTESVPHTADGWIMPDRAPRIDERLVNHYARRVREWTCELKHAREELAAARAASEAIGQQLLDE